MNKTIELKFNPKTKKYEKTIKKTVLIGEAEGLSIAGYEIGAGRLYAVKEVFEAN